MVPILLFHGTVSKHAESIQENGILLSKSQPYLDFGSGFYTTPLRAFALNTARFRTDWENRKRKGKDYKPVVVVFDCDADKLALLKIKRFNEPTNAWGHFVIANRAQRDFVRRNAVHNFDHKYDCVIGPTADGRSGMIDTLVDLAESGKRPVYSINCKSIFPSKSDTWGEQYSFHTEKAISCLTLKDVLYYD